MMSEHDLDGEVLQDRFNQTVVTVVEVQRYIIDPAFVQQTGLGDRHGYDAYDITVADPYQRAKVVLSCQLNHLVQKRKIRQGSEVKLTSVKLQYDETVLNGHCIPVVEDLEIIKQNHTADIDHLSRLPWLSERSVLRESCPLASHRAYYMDVWSSTDVDKSSDDFQVQGPESVGEITSEDLYNVREIATRWPTVQKCKPPLLLRVMRRAKLFHYARPSKTDKWPFQLHLVVGDETGCCTAVFWNVMAPRYVNFVEEGRVMLIRNYTVKPRFQFSQPTEWLPPSVRFFGVDLNINAHHPQAEVRLIDLASVARLRDVRLPTPTTNFVTRKQLSSIPDGYACDVAGVVTFVGAVQREKRKGKSGQGHEGFWIKRWLHLQDHTTGLSIVVLLYRGVQIEQFEEGLAAGLFAVCRNMRVVHGLEHMQSSRQPRHVFVVSSRETQIYVHEVDEDVDYPFSNDDVLRSVRRFAGTARCEESLNGALCQMLFPYPPEPTSLNAFTAQQSSLELCPSSDWQGVVEGLSYRQMTQIAVQARLEALTFHPPHRTLRKSGRHKSQNPQQQETSSTHEAREDSCVYLGYNPMSNPPDASGDLPSFEEDSFFLLQWRGLNTNVVLNSLKPCYLHSCPPDLTLNAVLSGTLDARPGEPVVAMRKEVADHLVDLVTSGRGSLLRYLVILDVYCMDGETAIFGMNRAFPVVNQT